MLKHIIYREIFMSNYNTGGMSENEEMYLVTIARIQEKGNQGAVPLSALADALSVLPVSVNHMVRKMDEDNLVTYYPYKGVDFTPAGREIVNRILRNRRLWEIFLVKYLNMPLNEADATACRMEHITSDDVANRLDTFLDSPSVCFHGYPIPKLDGEKHTHICLPLNQLDIGQDGYILRIDTDGATLAFLSDEGIVLGVKVVLLARGSNGALLLEVNHRHIHLQEQIARLVFVQPDNMQTTIPSKEQGDKQMSGKTLPLSELKVGQRGNIKSIKIKGTARQRLMAMGLVKDEIISVERVAPLGDPIDFIIKNYHLSLRKSEASEILVELVTN